MFAIPKILFYEKKTYFNTSKRINTSYFSLFWGVELYANYQSG